MTVRNPIEFTWDQFRQSAHGVGTAIDDARRTEEAGSGIPTVRRIGLSDLRDALAAGFDDFAAHRSDVIFLCVIYPLVGLVLGRLLFGYGVLPLLFPLAAGFALVGPLAAVGLNEMSRRREQGLDASLSDAFGAFASPSIGAIFMLGLVLMGILLVWLGVAQLIYNATLGPLPPETLAGFSHDVFATRAGWTMIFAGVGIGFVFAVLVLAISVISFPLLLDRKIGVEAAVWTSVRAVAANPVPMAAWGIIVAGGLVLGSIPFLLGLAIVMPVLGHATWHLYRKVVPR